MLYAEYFAAVSEHLKRVEQTQAPSIAAAALLIVETMKAKCRTFVFGSGHSNLLTQETCIRAGGLPIFNPIFVAGLLPTDYPYLRGGLMERVSGIAAAALESSPAHEGDALIVISNSGRNHVPIEMALEALGRGLRVIALTSVTFSKLVTSRHPSGKRLFELADIVIDNCCPPGDAAVEVPGVPARIGPLSTIAGAVILHALSCQISDILLANGILPPVFISGNVDGADEYAMKMMEKYRDLITYL